MTTCFQILRETEPMTRCI